MSDFSQRVRDLYARLGTIRRVADELGLAPSTVHYHLQKTNNALIEPPLEPVPARIQDREKVDVKIEGDKSVVTGKGIKTLEDLLEAAQLDDQWVCTKHTLNTWQALGKDSEIFQLHQVKAYLERAPWFYFEGLGEMPIRLKRKPADISKNTKTALVIPDSQHGFKRIEDISAPGGYRWEPLHDRAALDVTLQVAELLDPDEIILLGDMLDLAPWSTRWTTDPSLKFTTNATLRELYAGFLRPLREICPSAVIKYMAGNHEQRIEKAILEKLDEAHGLRSADTLEGDELLNVSTLLALDSIDIEYLGPYGAAYWLFDQVRIQHGTKARPAGETASAYLRNATSSMIWGHVHRLEMAQRKIQTPSGPKIITAASPGCLCRTDGAVPHAGGDFLDWQQGLCLVYQDQDTKKTSIQLLPIEDGSVMLYGHKLTGDGSSELAQERTGLPF